MNFVPRVFRSLARDRGDREEEFNTPPQILWRIATTKELHTGAGALSVAVASLFAGFVSGVRSGSVEELISTYAV
jgi:hypothetical protein